MEKAAAGSGRPKTQHFSVDPGHLSGDPGTFSGQDVGSRAGTGERLRQVDHVPDQAKLLEVRERCLAPPLAAKKENRQVVAGKSTLLGQRSQHLDVTFG